MMVKKEDNNKEQLKKPMMTAQNHEGELVQPRLSYISAEVADDVDKEFEESNTYKELMQEKLLKQFNSKKSRLSMVGKYLWKKIYTKPVLSKTEITRDLRISIAALNGYISKLNQFRGYGLTLIPVKGKRGFIRAVTSDRNDYEAWKNTKKKSLYALETTLDKGTSQGDSTFEEEKDNLEIQSLESKKKKLKKLLV